MIHTFKTDDHPEANGRVASPGDQTWTFTFPLDGGDDYLELKLGRKARDAFKRMLEQEEIDDLAEGSIGP